MNIKEFFDTDFKSFSMYDNERSIPSLIDGLKPTQRKIIYALLVRGENKEEIKVAQLGPYAASVAAYHHGESSICGAVVGLAQNFAGTNNMNLLEPSGQFGSRLSPESAAHRYIFTKFSDNFRKLFRKEDELILQYLDEDGQQIEPETYFPILPISLINGSVGIGTGFATNILCYNPEDIKQRILEILDKKKLSKKLTPWFKGFKGKVERVDNSTLIKGILKIENTTTIKITELPVGMYLFKYKEILNSLEDSGFIKSYEDNSTEDGFEFEITCPRTTTQHSEETLLEKFKLISKDSENFTLWIENHKLKNFKNVDEVVEDFVTIRLRKYEERRLAQIKQIQEEIEFLNERKRFIEFYIQNSQSFSKKNKKQIVEILETNKFKFIDELLDIRIHQLTGEAIEKLEAKLKESKITLDFLKKTNNVEMYKKELAEFKSV